MSNLAYLSLGSNVGDREENLREAVRRLKESGKVISVSAIYETEPVEFTGQAWFLNCAVAFETTKSAARLMVDLLEIEQQMGRVRVQKKGPRIIDIDILLFGDVVVETAELTIPHPAMAQRRFVLEPMAEIAAEAVHPIQKRTIRELLEELPAGPSVRKTQKR